MIDRIMDDAKKRQEILKTELSMINFPMWEVGERFPKFMQYLTEVLYTPIHEGKYANSGIIFGEISNLSKIKIIETNDLKFSNGINSFLVIPATDPVRVITFIENEQNELTLYQLSKLDCLILQRVNNTLKIFFNGNIYIEQNRIWRRKEDYKINLHILQKHAPMLKMELFEKIIRFAYYYISANNVGGTLVYLLKNNYQDHNINKSKYKLSFIDKDHYPAILSYLGGIDGATFINKEGQFIQGEVHLQSSKQSTQLIRAQGGTRHTSAKRYTYEKPELIIITISEDGPVTIFSDGFDVFTLNIRDIMQGSPLIESLAKDRGEYFDEGTHEEKCSNCGKYTNIYANSTSGGWNEWIEIQCKICGNYIDKIKAFEANSFIIKKFN